MVLALGLIGCAVAWWLSKKHGGFGAAVAAFPRHLIAGWAALAGAGMLLLHGNLLLAALLGIGGLWSLEGPAGLGRRLRSVMPTRATSEKRIRTRLISIVILPDGSFAGGRVRSGPLGGARLDALNLSALVALLGLCRGEDREGATILETYLDRRAPGWRVDAERDGDPWAGAPAKPGAMPQEQAYQILGLERGASTEEVRSAHRTLMKRAHPDQGGSAEWAARVNAARDRLLNRHR
ncbi:J domain-containing protein [Methylobacterium persicinum]|uniref:J domain-containing protein n=1 Tax=Methylobacterium persicinum TaxID=374426 RepID=A0ABU0HIE1_9HYPH|nr:DnaJ domain-containing protein [Methylobacterium persicinum]MDQ0442080.1 hypothetical protein [Methylobacterium persicinum]GJE38821.1 Co-chaperone protein DjlA [Methylobacterium persicinum]